MTTLSGKQRRHLRGLAHDLDPVVHVGSKGVTDGLLEEIDGALEDHELIKMKFQDFKDAKEELTAKICARLGAQEVGQIGHVVILFRPASDASARQIQLPAA